MFSKLALFAVASFATFVAAIPSPGDHEHGGNTQVCGTGSMQCCDSITSADNEDAKKVIQKLGVSVPVGAAVGITCSPIANIAAGNSCVGQTACCEDNSFSGALVVGCSPINL